MNVLLVVIAIIALLVVFALMLSIRIVTQYEQGVHRRVAHLVAA
jgi:regulator of protease activity HflC (stomatin/prohibitin superfamily)